MKPHEITKIFIDLLAKTKHRVPIEDVLEYCQLEEITDEELTDEAFLSDRLDVWQEISEECVIGEGMQSLTTNDPFFACSYEYPGYIEIIHGNVTFRFGTIDGHWSGDYFYGEDQGQQHDGTVNNIPLESSVTEIIMWIRQEVAQAQQVENIITDAQRAWNNGEHE